MRFKQHIGEMMNASLKINMDLARKEADELTEYMPPKEKEESKALLAGNYKESVNNIKENRNRLSNKTKELKDMKKLDFESVRAMLEYLKLEKNDEIVDELRIGLRQIWKKRKEEYTRASTISVYGSAQTFLREIHPFITKCKPYQ